MAVNKTIDAPFSVSHVSYLSHLTSSAIWEMARSLCERLCTPDKSGNYKSSFAIAIITFLVSARDLVHESKLANESLPSG